MSRCGNAQTQPLATEYCFLENALIFQILFSNSAKLFVEFVLNFWTFLDLCPNCMPSAGVVLAVLGNLGYYNECNCKWEQICWDAIFQGKERKRKFSVLFLFLVIIHWHKATLQLVINSIGMYFCTKPFFYSVIKMGTKHKKEFPFFFCS